MEVKKQVKQAKQKEIRPQPGPQYQLLSSSADVVVYGGSAGGGKTFGLLLDALRHIETPDVGAVFFRRTTTQITNEGGLWDEATDLYIPLGGRAREKPNHDIIFRNPMNSKRPGFKISFRHLQHEKDVHSYQGSQIAIIYFDELTHFTKKQFTYMLSRNRSTSGIRPYVRASTNPDKSSWVRDIIDWWIGKDGLPIPERSGVIRYLVVVDDADHWFDSVDEARAKFPEQDALSFTFIPSKLEDNKILMEKDPGYKAKLMSMNKVDRERLLGGNWDIMPSAGMYFKREQFEEIDFLPRIKRVVRCWDRAATEWNPQSTGKKPDATASVKMAETYDGQFIILDVVEERYASGKVETLILNTAKQDGIGVTVKGFQDPGSAGKSEAENFVKMMRGFHVVVEKISTDKITAAKPLSAQVQHNNVKILKSCRNKELLYSQLENFPDDAFDDVVDAATGAFNELNSGNVGSFTKEFVAANMKEDYPPNNLDKW